MSRMPEPQRHLARFGLKTRQEGHDLELLVVALVQVMLSGEERIPALVARQAHHGVLLVQGADHVGFETLLVGDEEAYFHVAFLCLRWMVGGYHTARPRMPPCLPAYRGSKKMRGSAGKCGVRKTFFIR